MRVEIMRRAAARRIARVVDASVCRSETCWVMYDSERDTETLFVTCRKIGGH